MARPLALSLLIVLVLGTACSRMPRPEGLTDSWETGMASYYGDEFVGRKTASGARYRADLYTAAHRTLPFGTRVRVTNLANERAVDVVINDRGPHRKGRIVDLSRVAAREIGLIASGVARVRLEVLSVEIPR